MAKFGKAKINIHLLAAQDTQNEEMRFKLNSTISWKFCNIHVQIAN